MQGALGNSYENASELLEVVSMAAAQQGRRSTWCALRWCLCVLLS
jgi:hypothetical protein